MRQSKRAQPCGTLESERLRKNLGCLPSTLGRPPPLLFSSLTPPFSSSIKSSMAEVNNGDEPLLPMKRSPDLSTQEEPKVPKKHKLEDNNCSEAPQPQKTATEDDCVKKPKDKSEFVDEEKRKEVEQAAAEEEGNSNGEAVIDRKGKGILIEEADEEEGDDDDDDSDSDSDSDIGDNLSDDSDFADDPLAEVDLDNILPSRTRRKSIQPGAYIANDLPDDDSDSDDPDA